MRTYPPVPSVVRITIKQSFGGDSGVINRFYMPFTGPGPTSSQCSIFANAVFEAWQANIYPLQPSDAGVNEVEVTDLTSATAGEGSSVGSGTGTRAGAPLSAGAAAVLQFGIPRRYRGGHPRMYLCAGVTGDMASGNAWTPAFVAAVPTAWVNFLAGFELSPWPGATIGKQVNVSYFAGYTNTTYPSGRIKPVPNFRDTPVVDTISAFTLNKQLGSQRRRNQQGA
jgi:hypothetical protein